MYDDDRQTILGGKWLWGTHLSAVQLLLKAQFPHLKGLEDTALVLRTGNTISPGSLQIWESLVSYFYTGFRQFRL